MRLPRPKERLDPATLHVVVWNMERAKARAWQKLDELQADICLLNEAVVPADRTGVLRNRTHGRDEASRNWGAAVISHLPIKEVRDALPQWRGRKRNVPFACSRPGTLEAGD